MKNGRLIYYPALSQNAIKFLPSYFVFQFRVPGKFYLYPEKASKDRHQGYLISLIIFIAGVVFYILSGGGTVASIIDLISFIVAGIIPFLFVCVLFGFKEMSLAFSASFKKENSKDVLIKAYDFFKTYGKVTWLAGFAAFFISFVQMLQNSDDSAAIGPNMALASVSILYSILINIVLVIPFMIFLKKQLKE
jgi:flagellar motor component MotA